MNQTITSLPTGAYVYHSDYGVMRVSEPTTQTYGGIEITCVTLQKLDHSATISIPEQQIRKQSLQLIEHFAPTEVITQALQRAVEKPGELKPNKKELDERLQGGPVEWATVIRDLNRDQERTFSDHQYLGDAAKRLRDVLAVRWQCTIDDAAKLLNEKLREHKRPSVHFHPFSTLEQSWNAR